MESAARHEFGGGDIGTPFAPDHLLAKAARHLDEKIAGLHFPPGAAVGGNEDMACFPSTIPQDPVDGIRPQLTAMDRPPDWKRSKRNIPHRIDVMAKPPA
ncbi:hypothetical protein [Mesorhizobium sp. B2-4-16]|uniref:hypothetical protein n=1 Tax=unclassified Mesorhizobium TaxID=325217 RepID=UPI0032B240F6